MAKNMIERHMENLRAMKGRSVEAGWFESARYDAGPDGKEGRSVAANARLQEYGGTIDHPGGTKYIKDAIVAGRYVGTRFVKNTFQGDHEVTKAHKIVIPARPFMRMAWSMFNARRGAIQKRLATDLVSGKITIDKALGQIGLELEACIVRSIRNGNWTPNAPSTVAKKGFDKPLIESSHMLQSVSSQVI
jgi:hypothetical protein